MRLGLELKVGLHTGACDVVGDVYSRFNVVLAKNIAAEAEPGNILVPRTVKDLVAGSGLAFEEAINRPFDGEWLLFNLIRR